MNGLLSFIVFLQSFVFHCGNITIFCKRSLVDLGTGMLHLFLAYLYRYLFSNFVQKPE